MAEKICNKGIAHNDIKTKLDLSDENDLLNFLHSSEEPREKENKNESGFEVLKIYNNFKICRKMLLPSFELLIHTKTHSEVNHNCDGNNKNIKITNVLKNVRVNANETTYNCQICSKHITVRDHMKCHSKEYHLRCKICLRDFSKKNFLRHLKTHTSQKKYICEICTKSFTRKENLLLHLKIHTNERNHKCEYCTKRFTSKKYLSKHVETHNDERNYQCETCSKFFRTKNFLSTHLRVHTGEKNYKCEICDKCFTMKKYLSNHLKTHNLEKNYKCEICTKCFKRNQELSRHVRTHAREKNYECEVCNEHFKRTKELMKHLKRHDEEIVRKFPPLQPPIKEHSKIDIRLVNEETDTFIKKEKLETNDDTMELNLFTNTNKNNAVLITVKPEPTEILTPSLEIKLEDRNE